MNRNRYFFRSELSDDDLYRSLDLIASAKDAIVSAMNRKIATSGIRDTSSVFYDVTNYYFEIDKEDALRKRGVSKKKRRDPIVQMGLLQDASGIPMGYRLFSGNTTDCQTMLSVLSDIKRDLRVERVVVIADKGLNCSTNICACIAKGDGFVFSESLKVAKFLVYFRCLPQTRWWLLHRQGGRLGYNCANGCPATMGSTSSRWRC